MRRFDIQPTQFRVADFIGWQRDGTLELNPTFQRRSVWKEGARSYFIDTIARGLPVPLVIIREHIDLRSQSAIREVVDGQQRLRSVFSFVDESLLKNFVSRRERFTVRLEHNPELAGKVFAELGPENQKNILGYRFSVQILPSEIEDRDVLQIFARLNSTGMRLNAQELRNAAWFGQFKTQMYEIAYRQLERWLSWRVFSDDQISRMLEVELTSDLVVNIIKGLSGKSQRVLDRHYEIYDASFPDGPEIARRLQAVMDSIDALYGGELAKSSFTRQMHFFTLFVYLYDRMFGLKTSLDKRPSRALRPGLAERLAEVDRRFRTGKLPSAVLEAVSGAATDLGHRKTRLAFVAAVCDEPSR